jgi:hypothetical protein
MTMTNTATIDRGTAHSAPAPAPEKLMALENLWRHAQGFGSQSKITALFVLWLYDGERFPFDLNTLRDLPSHVVLDCLVSLHMDHASRTNVAQLLGVHADKFERLAKTWGLAGAREFAA